MFKLFLEKAEKPEIKLPTSAGSSKKQKSSIYFCFIDYAKAFDCADTINCGKFWKRWEYQTTYLKTCLLRNLYAGQEATVKTVFSRKSVLNIHWKDCCWSWNSNTLATWCEELTHLKRHNAARYWRQEEKRMIVVIWLDDITNLTDMNLRISGSWW